MNVGSWRDTVITPSFPTSFWDASVNPKLNPGWRFFPPKRLLANVCEFAGKHEPLAVLPRVVHPAPKNMNVWAEEQECRPDRRDLAASASRICHTGICWWLPAQPGFFSHYCTCVGKLSLFGKRTQVGGFGWVLGFCFLALRFRGNSFFSRASLERNKLQWSDPVLKYGKRRNICQHWSVCQEHRHWILFLT